jgi:HD-GYP domain-containing protein (c-di-GMP phosphodiesterase class II)
MSDLIPPLSRTIDLMSPELARHHMQVSYLGYRLAEEAGFSEEDTRTVAIAGALHDIGAFSAHERVDLLDFELHSPHGHALAGATLLQDFAPLREAARLIQFHHVPWEYGEGSTFHGQDVPAGSHVLHLADRLAVLIDPNTPTLGQVPALIETVSRYEGSRFVPELVQALHRLARRDVVWLEAASQRIESIFRRVIQSRHEPLDLDGLLSFSRLLCRVIDFKSAFTATHSSGVAATSVALSKALGFSADEQKMMEIAAFLHDLGKLAIPAEILEKTGALTDDERAVMRTHVYYTYEILQPIPELDLITSWGTLHQERLSGSGYPFAYTAEKLPLGARVMAVSDVFTAITEDRPYRPGMSKEDALGVLFAMADEEELDKGVVAVLAERFDDINVMRAQAQQGAAHAYQIFHKTLEEAAA